MENSVCENNAQENFYLAETGAVNVEISIDLDQDRFVYGFELKNVRNYNDR